MMSRDELIAIKNDIYKIFKQYEYNYDFYLCLFTYDKNGMHICYNTAKEKEYIFSVRKVYSSDKNPSVIVSYTLKGKYIHLIIDLLRKYASPFSLVVASHSINEFLNYHNISSKKEYSYSNVKKQYIDKIHKYQSKLLQIEYNVSNVLSFYESMIDDDSNNCYAKISLGMTKDILYSLGLLDENGEVISLVE